MYLTATSARGLRFQGNGHPKKDAKAIYRAANGSAGGEVGSRPGSHNMGYVNRACSRLGVSTMAPVKSKPSTLKRAICNIRLR